ncbi:MAG TPA: hypothetical protein VL326_11145 [Kofleriaceae bacterium]|nr:hypothetical protein [Kofleriaceae bacterium]
MRRSWALLGIACLARIAHADVPPIEGHVSLGARASAMNESHYGVVYDDSPSVRLAVDGGVGLRFGRTFAGLRAGIATPLRFYSSPLYDSGEQVASTTSRIYPLDLGLSAQFDAWAGLWFSGWLGVTLAFTHATSPAQHINAIDYTGDIPAQSWSNRSTSLGLGAAVGYDILANQHGRFAALLAFDSQGVGKIPLRENQGQISSMPDDRTCRSLTLGVAYRY